MPTIDIPDKICPHCGGTKWFQYNSKYKDKVYTKYSCSLKIKQNTKRFQQNNPDKLKVYRRKNYLKNSEKYSIIFKDYKSDWYKENKERIVKKSQEWAKNNPEKHKELRKKLDRKASKNLSNRYVKSILSDDGLLEYSQIPQDLIELKRKQLLLKRKIKNNG
jgi:hypothetical protein